MSKIILAWKNKKNTSILGDKPLLPFWCQSFSFTRKWRNFLLQFQNTHNCNGNKSPMTYHDHVPHHNFTPFTSPNSCCASGFVEEKKEFFTQKKNGSKHQSRTWAEWHIQQTKMNECTAVVWWTRRGRRWG